MIAPRARRKPAMSRRQAAPLLLILSLALAACAAPSAPSIGNPAPSSAAVEDPLAAGLAAYDGGDYAQALELLQPLAAAGSAPAQVKLGRLYANGFAVEA